MSSLRSLLVALTACLWASTAHVSASSEASCVFVSNDHGDALQEWLRATADAGGPLAVLHIDAHNDLNVPDADSRVLTSPAAPAELRRRWQLNGTLASELAAAVDLANFQLAAVRFPDIEQLNDQLGELLQTKLLPLPESSVRRTVREGHCNI